MSISGAESQEQEELKLPQVLQIDQQEIVRQNMYKVLQENDQGQKQQQSEQVTQNQQIEIEELQTQIKQSNQDITIQLPAPEQVELFFPSINNNSSSNQPSNSQIERQKTQTPEIVEQFSPSKNDDQSQQQGSNSQSPLRQTQNLLNNLSNIRQQLIDVQDQDERIKLQEVLKEINQIMQQSITPVSKFKLHDAIAPNNLSNENELKKIKKQNQKIEINLQTLFLFYIEQFPPAFGIFYKMDIQNAELDLQMFMIFGKQFNIVGHDARKPAPFNILEQKRRGQNIQMPQFPLVKRELKPIVSPKASGIQSYQAYKKGLKDSSKKNFEHIKPKFQWWDNQEKFQQYYKPLEEIQDESGYPFHKKLDIITCMLFFKRNATEGKFVSYEQFKLILSKLADILFPNQNDALYRLQTDVLFLHKTKKMKSFFQSLHHAFEIVEKVGYRYDIPAPEIQSNQGNHLKSSSLKSISQTSKFAQSNLSLKVKSDNKTLSKHMTRALEVEQQQQAKERLIFDNMYALKISSQIRNMKKIIN